MAAMRGEANYNMAAMTHNRRKLGGVNCSRMMVAAISERKIKQNKMRSNML